MRQEVPVSVPLVLSLEWQLYDSNLKMYFLYRMFCFSIILGSEASVAHAELIVFGEDSECCLLVWSVETLFGLC